MRTPLGWLQLRHKPLRLAVALLGISFAVLLIMMQLGFRSALFESAVRFQTGRSGIQNRCGASQGRLSKR